MFACFILLFNLINILKLRGRGKSQGRRLILSLKICPMKYTAGEEISFQGRARERGA